jgi:hypothetical protein
MNRWQKEASMNASLACLSVVLVSLVGCAGKGAQIDVAIPGKVTSTATASSSGPRIAVLPFDDKRGNQMHLGQRAHLWGGTSYFDLPNGTVSKGSAQALVDSLSRQGWRASLARTQGSEGADVTILGTIYTLSIDATSGVMHTDLSAKNTLAFQIINHSDNSIVMERVSGSGTDHVFWFEPQDAQALTTELFESNFQKFVNDVRIDGRTIRLK